MVRTSSRDEFTAYTGSDSNEQILQVKGHSENKPRYVSEKNNSPHSSSHYDPITGKIIFTKDGGYDDVVDINDLRRKLQHLRDNSQVKIRSLSGPLKDDFDSLAQYVAWTYDSDTYHLLHAEIQSYFHPSERYLPGTIGAYCGGCLVKEKGSLLMRGCTVICAGSIPLPLSDPNWEFCDNLVIWASYTGNHFDFTTLNETEDAENSFAIIFIDYDSIDTFPSFSKTEIKTLSDHGIKNIRLVYYNSNANYDIGEVMYVDVSGGFIPLQQLRPRVDNNVVVPPPIQTTHGWGWWLLIIIIAFLLLLFFFYLCKGNYVTSTDY